MVRLSYRDRRDLDYAMLRFGEAKIISLDTAFSMRRRWILLTAFRAWT